MELAFTNHAREQMQRRAIKADWVNVVTTYGKKVHKQGLVFYVGLRKRLPSNLTPTDFERIQNMVVVVSDDNVVITTYKNPNALRHIRKKPKRLICY